MWLEWRFISWLKGIFFTPPRKNHKGKSEILFTHRLLDVHLLHEGYDSQPKDRENEREQKIEGNALRVRGINESKFNTQHFITTPSHTSAYSWSIFTASCLPSSCARSAGVWKGSKKRQKNDKLSDFQFNKMKSFWSITPSPEMKDVFKNMKQSWCDNVTNTTYIPSYSDLQKFSHTHTSQN